MSRWFRHYAGMMRDDKLVSVAIRSKQTVERVVWIWGAILESAAEIDDAGRYDVDPAEIAYFLRADESDVDTVLRALEGAGRLSEGCVVKWGDRQFQSDRSADRQKRYRENKKRSVTDNNDNGGVTSPSRHGDAPETEAETYTDSSEANASGGEPPAPDPKKVLYDGAVALLTSQGETERNARSFISGLVKQHGGPAVMAALTEATMDGKVEAKRWLVARLKPADVPAMTTNETALSDWITRMSPRMRPDERFAWIAAVLKPIAELPEACIAKGIRDAIAEKPKFPNDMADAVATKSREWARLERKPSRPPPVAENTSRPTGQVDIAEVSALVASMANAKRSPDAGKAAA